MTEKESGSRQHVYPANDCRPHILSVKCACVPQVIDVDGGVIIKHNAFDGRESGTPVTAKGAVQ